MIVGTLRKKINKFFSEKKVREKEEEEKDFSLLNRHVGVAQHHIALMLLETHHRNHITNY